MFRNIYGISGLPYTVPQALAGNRNLGFMMLPNYRAWVSAVSLALCLATWLLIEKTRLGATLRAADRERDALWRPSASMSPSW